MATTVVPLAAAMAAAPRARALGAPEPAPFVGIRLRLFHSPRAVACALRRPSKYKTKIQNEVVVAKDGTDGGDDDDDDDEGGLEALFKQLEEDLKNDDLSVEDDDEEEISEEDMARFEQVLAEAIGDVEGADEPAVDLVSGSMVDGSDEVTDAVERPELKNWQLKRLARALKIGRRKTSMKNLAGELGLDRGLVIELLRNPPPKLLLMSDSLPDEAPSKPEIKEMPSPVVDEVVVDDVDVTETEPMTDLPIHVMSNEWSAQKRLKKVQLETLERVYRKSKRPTNTMISSIVQVTSLPRKTIIKWFEDRREQDGVPDRHAVYKRSVSETMAS
ncbi:protein OVEREXPRESSOR OF CATIONIC PEROXIDASE 3-like [Lolium rigidum]|uniref:protein OVEREXPRESSOR OF CATIONIC PEROXIDASE 3-like n=1 Tax=Lolium rigidum TaxID=89674 RepID=UPI001F5C1236|nr:protein OVEREXPRESSOR OF CATIONIC PEROXIDASE 3-like [Lolium rigidum]